MTMTNVKRGNVSGPYQILPLSSKNSRDVVFCLKNSPSPLMPLILKKLGIQYKVQYTRYEILDTRYGIQTRDMDT